MTSNRLQAAEILQVSDIGLVATDVCSLLSAACLTGGKA